MDVHVFLFGGGVDVPIKWPFYGLSGFDNFLRHACQVTIYDYDSKIMDTWSITESWICHQPSSTWEVRHRFESTVSLSGNHMLFKRSVGNILYTDLMTLHKIFKAKGTHDGLYIVSIYSLCPFCGEWSKSTSLSDEFFTTNESNSKVKILPRWSVRCTSLGLWGKRPNSWYSVWFRRFVAPKVQRKVIIWYMFLFALISANDAIFWRSTQQ